MVGGVEGEVAVGLIREDMLEDLGCRGGGRVGDRMDRESFDSC